MHIMWIDTTALSLAIKSKVVNKKTILFCYFVNIMLELSFLPVSCKIYTCKYVHLLQGLTSIPDLSNEYKT